MDVCRRVIYHGHVQGVGFRATVQNLAHAPVTGFVRNLSDGTVELLACGPDTAVRDLLQRIDDRLQSYIDDADSSLCPDCDPPEDFCIRY